MIEISTSAQGDKIILQGGITAELPFPLADKTKLLAFSEGTLLRLCRVTTDTGQDSVSTTVELQGTGVIRRKEMPMNGVKKRNTVCLFGIVKWCLCGDNICMAAED